MQNHSLKVLCLTIGFLGSSLPACTHHQSGVNHEPAAKPTLEKLTTQIVTRQSAKTSQEAWGDFRTYYEGRSDHVTDILTGVAVINPGEEIHPPHKHPEEEFLMVIEGNGTWSVEGVESPASAGDILFAVPGELHGIKNTGDKPLKFVVFKYNPK